MKVWLLPIEPFEERYTADWSRWFPADLRECGLDVEVIRGNEGQGERTAGEWLDPTNTWRWKGSQVAELAARWHELLSGDVVLSLDAWGPASTAALYMRQTTGKNIRVVGWWHAGAWDPHDYLARVGCGPWAIPIEQGWATGLDACLVGSHFAADLMRAHLTPNARIEVVGYPIKQKELMQWFSPWEKRERLVVFPHRLAPEKGVEDWENLSRLYAQKYPNDDVAFVRSRDVYTNKASLYELLGKAKVVVSCARQETFGIVMQEGVALGAHPLSPRRVSYPEVMRGSGLLYDSIPEAIQLLNRLLHTTYAASWDGHHERAIHRVAAVLKRLG